MVALARVSIVLLLLVQAYNCAALRDQQTAWVTKHLHRRKSSEVHTNRVGEKKLLEVETVDDVDEQTVSNGWRASLIRPNHKARIEKLTTFEKIRQDMEMSKKRAMYLFKGSRKTSGESIKKRRLLEDFLSEVEVTPGGYSMEISIGSPPQKFIAVADTGSDLVWLQCAQCNPCFQSNADFNPSLSSTYEPLGCGASCDILEGSLLTCSPSCQYTYGYGDNSTTIGDFSSETVWLTDGAGANVSITNFLFGCGLQNVGTFDDINGLVGLGRGPLSFPSQIAPYLNNNSKFSYCLLQNSDEIDRSPILFGETAVPSSSMNTTRLLPDPGNLTATFYYVSLLDISVGGSRLSIPSTAFQIDLTTGDGGVFFDSGTTYTILESEAYQMVKSAFNDSIEYTSVDLLDFTGFDLCYSVPSFDNLSVPRLTFNFDGADFDLPFDNIVQKVTDDSSNNFICLAFAESPIDSFSVIGNWQQQNFQVLYDLDNASIGWVAADCSRL
ncbi:hypothetical protein R1flu_002898 [Riccia fluitans]|uniref:Peptidase A1 domain-containing protein n=1 Tax=Riccia fluitans TaxID=41844 RepID=A0ABD1Y7E8_9MARC